MIILLIIFAAIVLLIVWQSKDRKKDPAKWAKIDAETARKSQEKRDRQYQEAVKPVPPSKWMLMSKIEKSRILAKREAANKNKDQSASR